MQSSASQVRHSMVEDVLSFVGQNPSVPVALFGIVVTLLLFWLGSRRNRMEATFKAIELMQEKDARNARFGLRELLVRAANHHDGFASLEAESRATLSSIALLFGFVGSLARRRRIYLSIFLDSFASSIVINHERLASYAVWRRARRGLDAGSLWKDFDWLAARAKRYVAIEAEPSGVRRMLIRLRLRKPRLELIKDLVREARSSLAAPHISSTATAKL